MHKQIGVAVILKIAIEISLGIRTQNTVPRHITRIEQLHMFLKLLFKLYFLGLAVEQAYFGGYELLASKMRSTFPLETSPCLLRIRLKVFLVPQTPHIMP